MTTYSTLWNPSCTTDAQLRACIQAYSDGLDAVGVVQTADTGQINIATAVAPAAPAANTAYLVGYQIRKLESPGKPTLYLRVRYNIVASTANTASTYRLSMDIAASTSTDGNGVLNGVSFIYQLCNFASQTTGPNASVSTTLMRPLYMASDGGNYLTVISDPAGNAGSGSMKYGYLNFAVERSINALTGEYDAEAFVGFFPFSSGTGNTLQVLNVASSTVAASGASSYQTPGTLWTTSGSLTQATIMPATVCVPAPKGPALASLLAFAADVTFGGQYQINMYGRLVTYMAVNQVYTASQVNGIAVNVVTPLLRFD